MRQFLSKTLAKPLTLVATLFLLSPLSWAMDLQQAKQQGFVGEQPDGYLGLVKDTPEAKAVMLEINAKRRVAYEALAKQNGVTVQQVGVMAGKKAMEKTAPGQFIRDGAGNWVKK